MDEQLIENDEAMPENSRVAADDSDNCGACGNEKTVELCTVLKKHRGERHAVLLQDYPDPDAISCGEAYRRIVEKFGIEVDLLYAGRVSHQENIALINLLNISLTCWDSEFVPQDQYQGVVFVDNQGTTCRLTDRFLAAGIPVVAMMDHHAWQENLDQLKPEFVDVRFVGACATLFATYLEQGIMPLENSNSDHRNLATALMHGIVSDTGAMIQAQSLDLNAAAYLQPFFDTEMLLEILHQKRSHKTMEVIRIALADRVTRAGVCLAGVGFLRTADRDAVPQAAEFLLSEENVHTVIVYAIVTKKNGEEMLSGSLRTSKHTLAPDTFLKDVLGHDREGKYYGGGKDAAGGFEIPLGFLSGTDGKVLSNMKWDAYSRKLRKRFFEKIGVEDV
ncbi:MAG: bifunctional oligoribonuclease/PAP phosphatase NrnA [Magnetococcales bacterium]|nr:bifunctional oligoribonuclease/PAP phosphatase NrnA [Magnetococcales bacterium]